MLLIKPKAKELVRGLLEPCRKIRTFIARDLVGRRRAIISQTALAGTTPREVTAALVQKNEEAIEAGGARLLFHVTDGEFAAGLRERAGGAPTTVRMLVREALNRAKAIRAANAMRADAELRADS